VSNISSIESDVSKVARQLHRRAGEPRADASTGQVAVIESRSTTKIFPRGDVLAVDDVSFQVAGGEFISIVGPSGCGKSTLLRMVAGLEKRTSGSLAIRGEDVVEPRDDAAMMFQKATLLPWRTAEENVLLPMQVRGRITSDEREKVREVLRLVKLDGFERAYPRHLSGGMQQRVALARLLVTGADLLLLDEPFGALDEFTREHMNIELQRIQADLGATVIFVTHNISEAVFLADRVFVMTPRPGRLSGIIDVPFERPRTIATMKDPAFVDLVFHVREILGESV
jgi:NitT/TauT family transport system ATP-binding protein